MDHRLALLLGDYFTGNAQAVIDGTWEGFRWERQGLAEGMLEIAHVGDAVRDRVQPFVLAVAATRRDSRTRSSVPSLTRTESSVSRQVGSRAMIEWETGTSRWKEWLEKLSRSVPGVAAALSWR